MAKHDTYEARTEALLEPIAKECGVSIYDVEFVNEAGEWYLRSYIDKEGGVTIDDCEAVSRRLSDELDKEDFIEEAYYLEVSSPGLGRTLKKDKHLQASIGQEVELKTYKPINKQKEFSGTLKAFDGTTVTLEIAGTDTVFNRSDVALIKLALDI
ncbi:MAG: ribosome maturation factor RimP [Lachnospiraceae bacterium]|nr:ribosome maturation factor RimP [Lachnospiraceae bacterium]